MMPNEGQQPNPPPVKHDVPPEVLAAANKLVEALGKQYGKPVELHMLGNPTAVVTQETAGALYIQGVAFKRPLRWMWHEREKTADNCTGYQKLQRWLHRQVNDFNGRN